MASGVAYLGYSLGTAVGPLITQYLMERYCWRGTLMLISGLLLHRLPLALTIAPSAPSAPAAAAAAATNLKHRDEEATNLKHKEAPWRRILDFSLYRNKSFVLFCAASVAKVSANTAFQDHLPSRAFHMGSDMSAVAWLSTAAFASATVIRIPLPFISNRLGPTKRPLLIPFGSLFGVPPVVAMLVIGGYSGALTGAILDGICTGTYTNGLTSYVANFRPRS